jgi:hypothetical protein
MCVDDNLANAGITQMIQNMIQQGNAANLNQWLWAVSGQRHHPRPLASCHDHCGVHMLNHAECLMG